MYSKPPYRVKESLPWAKGKLVSFRYYDRDDPLPAVFLSETQPPAYAGSSLGPFLEPHGLGRLGEPVHMNMELQLQLLPRGMKSSALAWESFVL